MGDNDSIEPFYTKTLQADTVVKACSVSENYVSFCLESLKKSEADSNLEKATESSPTNSEVFVIDVANMQEKKFSCPFKQDVTAVYIDNEILLIASHATVRECKPSDLMSGQQDLESAAESEIPKSLGPNRTIYAFWHQKRAPTAQVYVRNAVNLQLSKLLYTTQMLGQAQTSNLP